MELGPEFNLMYPQALEVRKTMMHTYTFRQVGRRRDIMKWYYPYNPNTDFQDWWRDYFAQAVDAWQNLAEKQKGKWNAKIYPRQMSGYNRFLRFFLKGKYSMPIYWDPLERSATDPTKIGAIFDSKAPDEYVIHNNQSEIVTNLLTFNRGFFPPFGVAAFSPKVSNLDADKCDGQHLGISNKPTFDGLILTRGLEMGTVPISGQQMTLAHSEYISYRLQGVNGWLAIFARAKGSEAFWALCNFGTTIGKYMEKWGSGANVYTYPAELYDTNVPAGKLGIGIGGSPTRLWIVNNTNSIRYWGLNLFSE